MSQTVEHRGGGRTQAQVKPWAIVHSPPKQKPEIARRYFNRQDAEDSLRFLKRWVKNPNNFSVAFMGETDTSIDPSTSLDVDPERSRDVELD